MVTQPPVFIRFSSHRARHYGLRAIEYRKPQAYYSLARNVGVGGVYLVTETEIAAMREYSSHARFVRLRGPFTDLRECFS